VGDLYITTSTVAPATRLGFGTWVAFGAGRVLVSLDVGDPDFDTVRETRGAKTHTLTVNEIPSHNHQTLRERSATTGGATTQIARTGDTSSTVDTNVFTENTGGGLAHNNLQPSIVVYIWERTA
jgi:microcystin-dependent protein